MLKARPLSLKQANAFVGSFHRHHGGTVGHKWSVGATRRGVLVGVAISGRPVAKGSDDGMTLEVARLCTDGSKNVCSFLYARCARIGKEMGYTKIQTYILESEPGTSLRAAGWTKVATTKGGEWGGTLANGKRRSNKHPTCPKQRWEKKC